VPAKVEHAIEALMRRGFSRSSAIRILKARHVLRQVGRHLGVGPRMKGAKR